MIKLKDILTEIVRDEIFSFEDVKGSKDVISHKVFTIKPFINPEDNKKITLKPFHFILGKSSLSIFEVFQADEIAGLKKQDCIEFLEKNKSEKEDGFIAGLTNVYDGKLFMFFNMARIENLTKEIIVPHECLHLARYLITLMENKSIDLADKEWWKKVEFTKLKDDNEEMFAEVLERCTYIVFDQLENTTNND
jgi:hypothetical protein